MVIEAGLRAEFGSKPTIAAATGLGRIAVDSAEVSEASQQKVDGGQNDLPLVHQRASMSTQLSTPYSCELWRHQHVSITIERHLGREVADRLPRERRSLSHRNDDPRVERVQQVRLDVDKVWKGSLRTRVLVSIDRKLSH